MALRDVFHFLPRILNSRLLVVYVHMFVTIALALLKNIYLFSAHTYIALQYQALRKDIISLLLNT
jgi:hypothetical protein